MISDIALNNKKISSIDTSVSNVNNTPVFSTMDVSNLNHTYGISMKNNTTLLNTTVENYKIMSETPVLLNNKNIEISIIQENDNSSQEILTPDDSLLANMLNQEQLIRSNSNNEDLLLSNTRSLEILTSENITNNISTSSTRASKNIVHLSNESFCSNFDNSLFWTILPDKSTNISSTQNVNMNIFQTPKRNKLSIAENIVNTIKIMSLNNQKSSHPGAFELDDHNDGLLTRSFVTHSHNRSPSILTLVFGGLKTSKSTSLLTRSPSEFIFDQLQVEENVIQKFKSLYRNESWITKRLYKFLIIKLQPSYNIYSVMYAEKFVKYLALLLKQIYKDQVNLQLCTDMLRYHMARYRIIKDTFDYLEFLTDYIPMAYYKKLVPGWNPETSAVKFDPQKYYIPIEDDEEFLNYIMEHLNKV